MSDWIDFYDFKHSVIYVNARHRDVHYRTIARDIRAYVPSSTAHVLDYGCGEATSVELVAAACGQVILALPAEQVETDPLGSEVGMRRIGEVGGDEILGVSLGDLRAVWERAL